MISNRARAALPAWARSCGSKSGAANAMTKELLRKRDISLTAFYSVKMPSNYIVVYRMAASDKIEKCLVQADREIDNIEKHLRAHHAAELVGLRGELKEAVSAYSGGMMQRLSLAIALLPDPDVLILDEPTVGIDPVLRAEIWKELRKLADGGATILITTHVMDEAVKCGRLAMMREGRVTAEGTPAELIERSGKNNIEEAFIYYGGGEHALFC